MVVPRFSRSRILEKLQRKVTSKTVNVIIKKRRLTAIFHNLYFCMRLTESGKSSFIPSSHEFSSVLRVREQLCFTAVETRAKKVVCSRSLKWAQQITKLITAKPRFMDTRLIRTVYFVPGKRKPLHFLSISTGLIQTPR